MHISNNAVDASASLEDFYIQLVKMTAEARRLELHDVEMYLTSARRHILNRQELSVVYDREAAVTPTLWTVEKIC